MLLLLLLLCSVVLGSCSKVLPKYNKLQKLRNRAACVLTFSNYDADDLQLLKKLNWDNLETRRQILKVEMVYKSSNGLSPDYGGLAADMTRLGCLCPIPSTFELWHACMYVYHRICLDFKFGRPNQGSFVRCQSIPCMNTRPSTWMCKT